MNGDEKASWSNETGTHTLCVRQAVTKLPEVERDVVTAQIHDAEDVVEVRLEGNHLMAEWDDGAGETTIDPAYELGTPNDLKILAVDSLVLIYYDGALMADIPKSGAGWYFTSGSYDVQSNPDKGEDDDAAAEVIIYLLQVEHTP
jgi:Alginate lyase